MKIKAFYVLCAISLSLLCGQSVFRATRKLTDLEVFTGQLDSAQVEYGMSRISQVIFHFRRPAAALGLDIGIGHREAQQLAAQVQANDTLVIYYDASGTLLHQRVNLLSYQVEQVGKRVIYPLAQIHRRYWLRGGFYGLLALVFVARASVKVSEP
jgi:hypothetical protein